MKKVIWIIAIIIIIIVGVLISKNDREPTTTLAPIKVGVLAPIAGEFAKYGEPVVNTIKMFAGDYNTRSEVTKGEWPRIEVVYEDTHADIKTAVSAYQKLISVDKIDVLVGPLLQAEMAALMPLIKKDNLPVFSAVPIPKDLRGNTSNPVVFWPDPTLESGEMAQYVYDQGIRTIGVLYTRDAWETEASEGFKEAFTKLGGKVVATEVVLQDTKEIALPVTKVLAAKPDAIFMGTYYKFVDFVRKARELGYKGKLFSIEIDSNISMESKPFSNGLQFISPAFYSSEYVSRYKQLYGEEPALPGGQHGDVFNMFIQMAEVPGVYNSDKKVFQQNLLSAMEKIRGYEGVSGSITFTPDHQAIFPLNIFEIQDGVINKIK